MKGDFTRDPLNLHPLNARGPQQHFTRVLMQQGRVLLDADFNAQMSILLHYLRTLASDLIGPHGGPADNWGFEIIGDADQLRLEELGLPPLQPGNFLFLIGKGHYYVDGVLCDNEDYVLYSGQPDLSPDLSDLGSAFLVYLDVWERHITYIEDSSIREVALGGPDTATRAQLIWQVKVVPAESSDEIEALEGYLGELNRLLQIAEEAEEEDTVKTLTAEIKEVESKIARAKCDMLFCRKLNELGRPGKAGLRARAYLESPPEDPCITPPEARYRGAENQLYRVEIHRDGSAWGELDEDGNPDGNAEDAATFKWSRDNGSVVAAWVRQEGDDLIVSGVRDRARGFAAGQWVELTDDEIELRGESGTMVKLVNVEGDVLTIDPETASDGVNWSEELKNPKVRRWDQKATSTARLSSGAVLIKEGAWIELEDGIWVQFQPDGVYHTGDYWLIPARTATGDVEWPKERDEEGRLRRDDEGNPVPEALPPHGVEHHYAPLAIISVENGQVEKLHECRCSFERLASPLA